MTDQVDLPGTVAPVAMAAATHPGVVVDAAGGGADPAAAGATTPVAAGAAVADVPRARGRQALEVAFPARDRYLAMVAAYHEAGFEMLSDLTSVDYLTHPGRILPDGIVPERFEVVVSLLSLSMRRRVRVRVQVPESDPTLPSLVEEYPGADALEREVYDLMGIVFLGHPDLTRILMPEDWEGHPLRKDYGVGRVPVQFKEAPGPR